MNTHKTLDQSAVVPKMAKLRESCDSCLLAKVKCSKTRPICGRCLANGANCAYSPSSRAGRKHRNGATTEPATNRARYNKVEEAINDVFRSSPSSVRIPYSITAYEDHPNFSAPSICDPDRLSPRHSMMENRSLAGPVQGFETSDFRLNPPFGDDFADGLQFPPQPNFTDPGPRLSSPSSVDAKSSINQAWAVHETPHFAVTSFQNLSETTPYDPSLSSPSSDGTTPRDLARRFEPHRGGSKSQCDCFALCIQALQALHSHSWLPGSTEPGGLPFDVVLTINREALQGCGAMLDCVKCVSKTGSSISTMLLGTIFGKIISLYGAACLFRFGPASDSQAAVRLAYGAYTVTGEDRRLLEMEIIIRELNRVETVLTIYQERFRNAEAEKDESSVYNALTGYLEKNLHYILAFLHSRKGGV